MTKYLQNYECFGLFIGFIDNNKHARSFKQENNSRQWVKPNPQTATALWSTYLQQWHWRWKTQSWWEPPRWHQTFSLPDWEICRERRKEDLSGAVNIITLVTETLCSGLFIHHNIVGVLQVQCHRARYITFLCLFVSQNCIQPVANMRDSSNKKEAEGGKKKGT